MQTKDGGRAIKQKPRTTLGYQKLRWVQQKTVIHREGASKRSLEPESQSHRVGPMRSQIRFIDRRDKIARRHGCRIFLAKQLANAPEHIAAIVKRNNLHRPR